MITAEQISAARDKAFEAYRKKKQIPTHFVDAAQQIIEQAGVQPWNFCLGSLSRKMVTTRRERFPSWALLPTVRIRRVDSEMF